MNGHKPPRWPMWAIISAGVLAIVGLMLWGGSTYDSQGNPIFDTTSASVLIAMFTVGGTVLERNMSKIKHEVVNNHKTNLRNDIDDNHEEIVGVLFSLQGKLTSLQGSVETVKDDLSRVVVSQTQGRADVAQLRQDFSFHTEQSSRWVDDQTGRMARLEGYVLEQKGTL